jgi:hypothetical protein
MGAEGKMQGTEVGILKLQKRTGHPDGVAQLRNPRTLAGDPLPQPLPVGGGQLRQQGRVEKVVVHQIHQPNPCPAEMPEGPKPVTWQIAHHHDKMGSHHHTLDVRVRSLRGINLDDLSLPRLQWAPQEMIDGGASALVEQNDTLPPLQQRDSGQLGKRHCAVDW